MARTCTCYCAPPNLASPQKMLKMKAELGGGERGCRGANTDITVSIKASYLVAVRQPRGVKKKKKEKEGGGGGRECITVI